MCGIWDWQSTIVKDLNDSQHPKHTLICRENAFVAIYALFQTTNVRFLPVQGGGSPKADIVHFFDRFSYMMASLSSQSSTTQVLLATTLFAKYPSSTELGERYTVHIVKHFQYLGLCGFAGWVRFKRLVMYYVTCRVLQCNTPQVT